MLSLRQMVNKPDVKGSGKALIWYPGGFFGNPGRVGEEVGRRLDFGLGALLAKFRPDGLPGHQPRPP